MSAHDRQTALDIAGWFEQRTGQKLSESRLWRVETTLMPVIKHYGLRDLSALRSVIATDAGGPVASSTIDGLLNHESSFFRDPAVFHMIEHELLPHLRETLAEPVLRIWCAGCSTGQEAYSLAMILRRHERLWQGWRVSILGTDISPHAVATANSGLFRQIDVQRGMAINDIMRWFQPSGEDWRASSDIRSLINFRTDNMLEPRAVSGTYDLILCRNVMLYFSNETRGRALSMLRRFSRPETVLLLGAGETTIGTGSGFIPSKTFRGAYNRADHGLQHAEPSRLVG